MARNRNTFGTTRKLPSGRWQARYTFRGAQQKAPHTFTTKMDAQAWLANERRSIDLGVWEPVTVRQRKAQQRHEHNQLTVSTYFEQLMARPGRQPATVETYKSVYNNGIAQQLGNSPLVEVTCHQINEWWGWLWRQYPDRHKRNSDCYTLVATIFNAALDDELIEVSPVKIKGAGTPPEPKRKALLTDE